MTWLSQADFKTTRGRYERRWTSVPVNILCDVWGCRWLAIVATAIFLGAVWYEAVQRTEFPDSLIKRGGAIVPLVPPLIELQPPDFVPRPD